MTLYFKMNRHLQMMLQHGLFHLHIIVIVVLEKVVAEAEVVVKSNEKVVAEADVFNEKVAEAEVVNEKVVAEAVLLIKTKKKEVAEVVEIVD